MATLKGKGTTLQQTIASVLTDVAQAIGFNLDGEESETFDGTTLDVGPFKVYPNTGYTEPGTVKMDFFFDPALAGHITITNLLSTPASCVWKLKYSDSGPSSLTYTSTGVGLGQTVVMNDGLKGSLTMKRSGAPTRA